MGGEGRVGLNGVLASAISYERKLNEKRIFCPGPHYGVWTLDSKREET